ncbi:MAG: YerC/YecD family TrpR-related protein [bacterium]|nr:YerC/YecD family TrpR-related protein [bacterium]
MPKKSIKWDNKKNNELFEAILALKTKEECNKFFRDLCTLEEMTDLTDRWQMVKLIVKGQPYRDISEKLQVSTTTVARVANWLNQGKGGYRLIVNRLKIK